MLNLWVNVYVVDQDHIDVGHRGNNPLVPFHIGQSSFTTTAIAR